MAMVIAFRMVIVCSCANYKVVICIALVLQSLIFASFKIPLFIDTNVRFLLLCHFIYFYWRHDFTCECLLNVYEHSFLISVV